MLSPARNKIAHTEAESIPYVNRIEELIFVLASQEVRSREHIARCQHRCKICGKKAKYFRSYCAKLEYKISAICQSCQDYYILSANHFSD